MIESISHADLFPDEALDPDVDEFDVDSNRRLIPANSTLLRRDMSRIHTECMQGDEHTESYLTRTQEAALAETIQMAVAVEKSLALDDAEPTAEQCDLLRAGKEARERLVLVNLRFASFFARASMGILPDDPEGFIPPALPGESKRWVGTYQSVDKLANPRAELEDRTQVAMMAMWKAAGSFQPSERTKSAKFITYAAWQIQADIERYSRDHEYGGWHMSSSIMVDYLKSLRDHVENGYELTPRKHLSGDGTLHEGLHPTVAFEGRKGVPMSDVMFEDPSEHDVFGDPARIHLAEVVADPDQTTFDDERYTAELGKRLQQVFGTIDDRVATVIQMRYGLDDGTPKSLDEVARIFGLSRERIRQLESRGMSLLRHPSRSTMLKEFIQPAGEAEGRHVLTRMGHSACSAPNVLTERVQARSKAAAEVQEANQPDAAQREHLEPWQAYPDESWDDVVRANVKE
jgi:RNA polymerase sigma factor (sigma-70 family)